MTYNYFVYILQCFRDSKDYFYRGRTNNFRRRYYEHKNMRCKFTKRFYGNIHPVYLEVFQARSKKEAERWGIRREKQIKNWSREKVKKITNLNRAKLHELIQRYMSN